MDIKDIFLVISTIFACITPIIGIRSILKGEYKPQRTTRLILLIVTLLFIGTLFATDNLIGIVIAVVQLVSTTSIFILSIKYGMGGTSKTDVIVFILAMFTLFIWRTTDNAVVALYLSIITDFIGGLPALIKSYKLPYTEDPKFYGSDIFAGFFNLLAQRNSNFSNLAFPGYIFLINLICALVIVFRREILKNTPLRKW